MGERPIAGVVVAGVAVEVAFIANLDAEKRGTELLECVGTSAAASAGAVAPVAERSRLIPRGHCQPAAFGMAARAAPSAEATWSEVLPSEVVETIMSTEFSRMRRTLGWIRLKTPMRSAFEAVVRRSIR
jgi:hypothetical protein